MKVTTKGHREPNILNRAVAKVRRLPRLVVILALLGFLAAGALVWLGTVNRDDADTAQLDAAQTQQTLDEVADPLAALCASDPSVRARVGEACATAREVVEAPPSGTPGQPGQPGAEGRGITSTSINAAGRLVVSYSDGASIDVGPVVGRAGDNGADGRGIANSTINDGRLVLTFSDGSTQDLGQIVGQRGAQGEPGGAGADGGPGPSGRGITDTTIVDGRLIISYDDGTTDDAGPVPAGPPGERGEDGSPADTMVLRGAGTLGEDLACIRAGGPDTAPVYDCEPA